MPFASISSGLVATNCLFTNPAVPFIVLPAPSKAPPVRPPNPAPNATCSTLSFAVPFSVGSISSAAAPPAIPPLINPMPAPTGKAGAIPPIKRPTFLAVGSSFSNSFSLATCCPIFPANSSCPNSSAPSCVAPTAALPNPSVNPANPSTVAVPILESKDLSF